MALCIGFSKQYYTLWDVQSDIEYGQTTDGMVYSYPRVTYTYYQNLSKDLDKAQAKAKEMGVKNLEPDVELYGRNSSFEYKDKQNYCSFPRSQTPFMPYTSEDKLWSEATDDQLWKAYRSWDYSENVYMRVQMVKRGHLEIVNGDLYTPDKAEKVRAYKKAFDRMNSIVGEEHTYEVIAESNIKTYQDSHTFGFLHIDDPKMTFTFTTGQFLLNSYNGFTYGLPKNDKTGRGMRIKGKKLRIVAVVEYCEHFEENRYFVKSLEIIK